MADIMGANDLALYQWKKHGRCSGLTAVEYFSTARKAYDAITRPDLFRDLSRTINLPAKLVEAAFLEVNENISPAGLQVTCKAEMIHEVRICLINELTPHICGHDVRRDCSYSADLAPIR